MKRSGFGIVTALCFGSLALASAAQAQSARQTAEMTARGCVIRSEAGQRYWACPPGALESTGSIAPQARSAPAPRSTPTTKARNYCVRMCDGYYFPLEGMANKGDAQREVACNRICPGAETKVYSTRPSEEIGEARSVSDRRRYSELEVAFLHRLRLVDGCSCKAKDEVSPVEAARSDETLQRGDIIVTETGMEVYQGESRFVDYREADTIGRAMREDLTRRLELSLR